MTSAQALQRVFAVIAARGNSNTRFLAIAAEELGLIGEDREVEALRLISRAIRLVKQDIELLPTSEEAKNILRNHIGSFAPLVEFSHAHLDMTNMLGNCFKASNILGLTYID